MIICNIIDGPIRVVRILIIRVIRNFCGKPFTSCTAYISPIVLIILWYTVRNIIDDVLFMLMLSPITPVGGGRKYTELELWYGCVREEVSFVFLILTF